MKVAVILFFALWLAIITITAAIPGHPKVITHHSSHSGTAGGGNDVHGKKYSEHKALKKSGKKSVHDEEKANKGVTFKELRKKDDEEGGGKKMEHVSAVEHKSFHKSVSESHNGANFHEGSHKKKANYKKGFREKFHKDEEKLHDSFFSNSHKSGEYKIFGKKNSRHASEAFAKKQLANHKNAKSQKAHGKSSKKVGGHNVGDKKAHQDQKTLKNHHEHHEAYGKKGAKKGGKLYKYKVPK